MYDCYTNDGYFINSDPETYLWIPFHNIDEFLKGFENTKIDINSICQTTLRGYHYYKCGYWYLNEDNGEQIWHKHK